MPLVPFASPADLLGLVPGASNDVARLAVERASSRIREYVHWNVDQETATFERLYRRRMSTGPLGGLDPALGEHDHPNRYHPSVVLPAMNLTSVASVVVDGRTLTATEWDATTSGIVYLNGVVPQRKVTVTYTAGWVRYPEDEAPGVFKDVCLDLAAELASNPERLRAYRMGGDSEQFGDPVDLTLDNRLDAYRVDAA